MARSIPTYERRFLADGVQGGQDARSSVSASNPLADAMVGAGRAGMAIATDMLAEDKKKIEAGASVDVANVLSSGEVYWQEDSTRRMQAWQPGAPDMRDGIGKDFDKWAAENEQKLPTEASKNYFRQHVISMKTRMQTNAFAYQEKATTDKRNAETEVAVQADENIVFADPSRYTDVFARRTETILARTDIGDADKIRLADAYKRKLSLAVERGEMEKDPAGWYARRFGAPPAPGALGNGTAAPAAVGFDGVMAQIFKTEGGYSASDGNTGAPVNFGINQKANPDIDVKGLTQAGAAKLYKTRYWDKIDGDKLPPALQGTAMDAAVNQGPERAKKWIQESGGDPAKFNALRRAHYETLLAKPENERFRKTWMERLSHYESAAPVAGMAPQTSAPATFGRMDYEQQNALREQAEAKIKQNDARVTANVVGKSADIAVAAQNIGNDMNIDIAKAKAAALADARAALGRDLDDVQQNQVEAAVERAAGVRERDRKRAQENITQSVFDALDQNGGDYQAVQRDMAGDLQKLPRDMDQRAQKYAGMVATGETRPTDWVAYSQIVNNPKLLMATNLPALRDKFGASEYAQLVKMQAVAKDAADKGMPDQTIQGDMALVKTMLKDAGVKDDKKEAMFFSALQREMDARRATTGQEKLKQSEVKEIAADLLVREVTSKVMLWNSETPAFQIEVPPVERAKIQAALTEAGLPVNESTILRAYRNKLNRKPETVEQRTTKSGVIQY